MKKTKIVSTLGPSSSDVETIVKLIQAGANVFRFNFSHGDHEEHLSRMNAVHEAEKITGKTVGILLDTKGAEIRTTKQVDGKIEFQTGDVLRISMDENLEGTKEKIAVTYAGLFDDVQVGGQVLFDDGLLGTTVLEKDVANRELVVRVDNDGILGSRKGVNAPGVSINLPGITEKDADDIRFGLDHGINYIAASFVRKPEDVLEIRALLKEKNMEHVQIVPKIESQEGIDNLDAIIAVSDGLMVPRGDMGVEIPAENVPLVQKEMIRKMNLAGLPVITATQMLDSMEENPRPTRAEASDVANAVFDGTDATMLSGESANGEYPVEAVATMAAIDEKAESSLPYNGRHQDLHFDETDATEAVASAVSRIAHSVNAKAIVVSTNSGYTARMVSKYRPEVNILAVTYSERVQRGLTLNYGVLPVVYDAPATIDEMIALAKTAVKEQGLANTGDTIVIAAGVPMSQSGTTNMITVQTV
ncbi:pyruvate kinase [Leuconostoc lactis]|uniref:pyruvate kinase n=1 Tax=Leuconostoc lactis TaxID=1246 RepID=UPI00020DA163|nr:pyruvate kinase [Leuconostoc lactis]KQB81255.1 pyruvate kinase [Leuconostoc lactis]MCT3115332.1 pyruvate kinase [Leuconostoc lactis]ORI83520.1 pyruvate kinase [Leuconostoc lactis]ORI86594.1 pyruvate kinase [Leuconostoc lactis]QEA47810.1 pyruvate kinase [Leuconostoc lactis]